MKLIDHIDLTFGEDLAGFDEALDQLIAVIVGPDEITHNTG